MKKKIQTLLKYINRKAYKAAYKFLNSQSIIQEKNYDFKIYNTLKAYIYIELGKQFEITNFDFTPQNSKFLYKSFNRIDLLQKLELDDSEKFESKFLNFEPVIRYAKTENELLFSIMYEILILDKLNNKFINSKVYDNKNVKLLNAIIKKRNLNNETLLLLAKNNILLSEIEDKLSNNQNKDIYYFLTLKELIFNGRQMEKFGFLYDNLDNWDIYEFALKNNIKLKYKDTINYKYYEIINGSKNYNFFYKLKSLKQIIELSKYFDIESMDPIYQIFLKSNCNEINFYYVLNNNFNKLNKDWMNNEYVSKLKEDDTNLIMNGELDNDHIIQNLEIMIQYMKKLLEKKNYSINDSMENKIDHDTKLKMIISILLNTKKIENILLGLYLCGDSWEYSIIKIKIYRKFGYLKGIINVINYLNVKNIQLISLSSLWYDLCLLMKISKENEYIKDNKNDKEGIENNEYQKYLDDIVREYFLCISDINTSCIEFIKNGIYDHAISIMKLKYDLINDERIYEIKNNILIDKNEINNCKNDNFDSKSVKKSNNELNCAGNVLKNKLLNYEIGKINTEDFFISDKFWDEKIITEAQIINLINLNFEDDKIFDYEFVELLTDIKNYQKIYWFN